MAQTNASIAKKARSRAEADFATWLMMAKLGSYDDLPPNAQEFLARYRARFSEMSEAKSKTVAVNEIYLTYYKEMGGSGTAPEPPSAAGGVIGRRRQRREIPETGRAQARPRRHAGRRPASGAGAADLRRDGGGDRGLQVSGEVSAAGGSRASLASSFCTHWTNIGSRHARTCCALERN